MNDDQKDENLTQAPASQSGFVADYNEAEQASGQTETPTETNPAQVDEPTENVIGEQPQPDQPQDVASGEPLATTDTVESTQAGEAIETPADSAAPTAEIPQQDQVVDTEPEVEEVPGIDVSAGEAEIDAAIGVDEVEAIEPIDDTLDALSGDL